MAGHQHKSWAFQKHWAGKKSPTHDAIVPNIWNKDSLKYTIIMLYYIYIYWLYTVCIYNNHFFFAHELHQHSSTAPPLAPSRMAKKGAWRCRKGINRHRLVPEICTESVACTWESWGKYRELFHDPDRTLEKLALAYWKRFPGNSSKSELLGGIPTPLKNMSQWEGL